MPSSNIFTWRDGAGWLVLSGGNEPTGVVRALALERVVADGALVCTSFGDVGADAVLDDMADLGAPAGYLVNVLTEDDETVREYIGEAGIVVLSHDADAATIRSNLLGAPLDGLEVAHERGAVILAEGAAATLFGAYLGNTEGFGWVERAYVAPGLVSAAESEAVRGMIAAQPDVIVIGPQIGAAMAFGGSGKLETWGNKQVTLALGNAYTSS